MAIAEGGVGKLDWDEGFARRAIKARIIAHDGRRHRGADEVRQKVIDDDPLKVPGERPASIIEQLGLGQAVRPQAIDQAVVRVDEGNLEPGHERVYIVPGVANQRDALLVARHIAAIGPEEQLGRIRLIVEVGRADRAAAVQRLEIRARRANVAQCLDVAVHA